MSEIEKVEKSIVKKNIVKIVYGEGIEVSGVDNVVSVDSAQVELVCGGSDLVIRGEEFNVERLSLESGEIKIAGKVKSLAYDHVREKQSFIKRILK